MKTAGRPVPHGTASSYNNHGCRCDPCRAAATAARRAWRRSLADRPFRDVPHGAWSGYAHWGCHCDPCTAAGRKAAAAYRARRLARTAAEAARG